MSQKDYDMVPRWYVVHTYSGYENKVKKENKNKKSFFKGLKAELKKVNWPTPKMCIRDRLRWLERTPDKREVDGSIPFEPTN